MGTYWDEFIAKKGTEIEGMELVDILEMFFNWTGVASAVTRAKIERDKFKARAKELEEIAVASSKLPYDCTPDKIGYLRREALQKRLAALQEGGE